MSRSAAGAPKLIAESAAAGRLTRAIFTVPEADDGYPPPHDQSIGPGPGEGKTAATPDRAADDRTPAARSQARTAETMLAQLRLRRKAVTRHPVSGVDRGHLAQTRRRTLMPPIGSCLRQPLAGQLALLAIKRRPSAGECALPAGPGASGKPWNANYSRARSVPRSSWESCRIRHNREDRQQACSPAGEARGARRPALICRTARDLAAAGRILLIASRVIASRAQAPRG